MRKTVKKSDTRKPLYVQINAKTYKKAQSLAKRLDLPKARVVELALEDFFKRDPQLKLNLK